MSNLDFPQVACAVYFALVCVFYVTFSKAAESGAGEHDQHHAKRVAVVALAAAVLWPITMLVAFVLVAHEEWKRGAR